MKVVLASNVEAARNFCAPETMSPGLEKVYRRTVERFSADAATGVSASARVTPKLSTRIILNGREFASVEEMPAPYRRFYLETLTRALPLQSAIYTVARTEHVNRITRTVTLSIVAVAAAAAVVYLWLHGYYG